MRNMSFALTERQFLDGSKTVTRRLGWKFLEPGERVMAVRKCMGLKRGEKVQRLGEIEVVSVSRQMLGAITPDDCVREGFPELSPEQFACMFCREMGCDLTDLVTRIEFRRIL